MSVALSSYINKIKVISVNEKIGPVKFKQNNKFVKKVKQKKKILTNLKITYILKK